MPASSAAPQQGEEEQRQLEQCCADCRGPCSSTTRTTRRTMERRTRWQQQTRDEGRRRGGGGSTMLLFVVAVLCLAGVPSSCLAESHQCAVGLKTPGRTWPAGDIVLEHGSPLRILCILNMSFIETSFRGKNSSDLVFFKGQREIEPEFISVLNETAIQLDVSEPPPENAMYYCKLRLDEAYAKDYEAVCLNKVVVGFKPQEPRSFDCVSRNWENMTCAWEPFHNYVDTAYTITFKLPGRAGGRKLYPCPSDTKLPEPGKEKPRNTCYWDSTTNPIYRQPYEYYTFFLTGWNVLGNWTGSYKFHHFAHVIPAKPTNLTVVNKTLDSALLHWSVSFPMQTFPSGLHHRVAHQNQWDSRETWQIINITEEPHNPKRYYNLTGLKYANAIYDIRVYIKSAVAIGEDKWSNFSDVTFRTPARVPGQSPRTDAGSFEISENNLNRDVYLYWQSIPTHLENGDGFRYQVSQVEENGRRIHLAPNETTRTYAKFRGLSHHSAYRFEIVASNEVGILERPARIFVPSRNSIPKEPVAFTKIAFEEGLYELSWKPPIDGDAEITNYTIFWCENDRDRPYQCQGYLEWLHVPRTILVRNVTVPDPRRVYQFAISANGARASSGMMWASCTVIHNKVVGKMKTVWINRIGSTVIEVGWKLDCSDRIGIVEGFKIYYCPIVSPYNLNCKGPKLNTTIRADLNTIRGEVRGLKPYTTYMIAVAVLTKNGEGQHSDPLYNTTLESPPSEPPRDVHIHNVTNTTMFISWREPLAMNGVLRYYVVHYNEQARKVEEVPRVELVGLLAHRNYSVRVAACTVDCSAESEPVHALTAIGLPDRIQTPMVRFVNSSQVRVLWTRPQLPAGPLNYYQIKSYDGEIQNTTSQEASLLIPDCQTVGREKLYRFQVRAVNIAPNNEHLFGNWSDAGEGNCFINGPSYRVWIIIWVIGSICGIAFVFCVAYSSKRVWLKCKAMQDVEVKLPPGLAPNMKLLQKSGDQHTRQSSADSSGCSSGQESVTSSLTSDSQVSSDSGAEVDPVLSSKKQLMIDATTASTTTTSTSSPAWESSSLRQRNVAGASKPSLECCGAGVTTRWDPYVKVAKGSTEPIVPSAPPADCLSLARSTPNLSDNLGYAASQQTWSSTGYISMPSSEEMSSNPSPVPKENPSAGSYSVVGVISKSPLRCKSEEETISLAKAKIEPDTGKPATNPYVSLVSLEQKSKDAKRTLDSLRVFDDLSFDKSKSKQQQQQQQQTPPQSQQPDKLSRPYVQTGFLEAKKPPQPPSTSSSLAFDATRRAKPTGQTPLPANFFAQASLAEELVGKLTPTQATQSDSKPYVTVASIAETTARKNAAAAAAAAASETCSAPSSSATSHKPYIPVASMLGGGDKGVVPASSVFQMLQQQQQQGKSVGLEAATSANADDHEKAGLYPSLELEASPAATQQATTSPSSSPASTFNLCWQPPASAKPEPTPPQDSSSVSLKSPSPEAPQQPHPVKTTSGYVTLPEQKASVKLPAPTRFAKPLQPHQQQAQQAHAQTEQQQQQNHQQQQQTSLDEQQYSKVAVVPRGSTMH